MTLTGGASALTVGFACDATYLGTVDYFTYALTRTDLASNVEVLGFATSGPSYVAKTALQGTPGGPTCSFTISQDDIPGTANDRGTFSLVLVRPGGWPRRLQRCPRGCA